MEVSSPTILQVPCYQSGDYCSNEKLLNQINKRLHSPVDHVPLSFDIEDFSFLNLREEYSLDFVTKDVAGCTCFVG